MCGQAVMYKIKEGVATLNSAESGSICQGQGAYVQCPHMPGHCKRVQQERDLPKVHHED